MYDNYNYPCGADTPDAPWNEPVIPERDFDIDIEFVMQKQVTLTTDNYIPEYDDEDGHTYANTEDTDWERVCKENGCYTIQELLQELEHYITNDLERCKGSLTKERKLKGMLESCKGWEVYDKSFTES